MPVVLTMMLSLVLAALGSALAMGSSTETLIAGSYRQGSVLFYAADAAANFALQTLAATDWAQVLDTGEMSWFAEGGPSNPELQVAPAGYRLYAHGSFATLMKRLPQQTDARVVVWLADLTVPEQMSAGRTVGLIASAFGPFGGRRSVAISARLQRTDEEVVVERLSWAQEP